MRLHPRARASAAFLAIALPAAAQTGITTRASLDSAGAQANGPSRFPAISADGRFVAFRSLASNLVPGDSNGERDVFVRDRISGQTSLVSVSSSGVQGNSWSDEPSISADGRYVAFVSAATNLVSNDTNGIDDIFVRDRMLGTTIRASFAVPSIQANAASDFPALSADGRFVSFRSWASNLTIDFNNVADIYMHDNFGGGTTRVSNVSQLGDPNSASYYCAISGDGRYVAFSSLANNLVPGDTNGVVDVFLRDTLTHLNTRVSVDSLGAQALGESDHPAISNDGRWIAFVSSAPNLVPGDTNFQPDVFVHDMMTGTTARVSLDSGGAQANGASLGGVAISADGRFVSFTAVATNLVPGDSNGAADVFVRDLVLGITSRASVDSAEIQADASSEIAVAISGDGRFASFASQATNLVTADTNGFMDVFVRDRRTAGFTLLCAPGLGGTSACPCLNPPSGGGRGCDNSSGTGGATLAASGLAYLASDSLVFTTSSENPTATSILLQGTWAVPGGNVFGQGLNCAGGVWKRLFTKHAVGGSIAAPNLGAGDPTVSARSAALGDPIAGGQSRWYLVYYRDPIVLGGCPAASTFNATATGRVDWSP